MEPALIIQGIIAAGAVGTAISVLFLRKSVSSQKKQLLVSNFVAMIDYIGDKESRENRRRLYRHYESKLMRELIEKYPEQPADSDLNKLNEAARQIGGIYNRVGFLLQQDKELKEKMINFHGFTMGVLWKIVEPLHNSWQKTDQSKGHLEFKEIGEESYCEWKEKINKYLAIKKEKNADRVKLDS